MFIEEYVALMKPVAQALDKLQDENEVTLGYVLPTLVLLKKKILNVGDLSVSQKIKSGLIASIEKRFPMLDLLNPMSKPYILAAVSHPKFKMSWIDSQEIQETVKNMFVEECLNSVEKLESPASETSGEKSSKDDDFFSDLRSTPFCASDDIVKSINEKNIIESQALNYLGEKNRSTEIVLKHEIVTKGFLKYNTTMPSSAPVERIFSTAMQIFTPRRNKLKPKTFEQLLILKYKIETFVILDFPNVN